MHETSELHVLGFVFLFLVLLLCLNPQISMFIKSKSSPTSVEVHFLMLNNPNCDCNSNSRWTRCGFPQAHPCQSIDCTGTLMLKIGQRIENAEEHLDIAMYNLTNSELKRNIAYAHRLIVARGFRGVRLLVDRSQYEDEDGSMGNIVRELIKAGVAVRIAGDDSTLMHNKFCLIDPETRDGILITGSLNWTNHGLTRNSENVLFIKNVSIQRAYKGAFQYMWNNALRV